MDTSTAGAVVGGVSRTVALLAHAAPLGAAQGEARAIDHGATLVIGRRALFW